MSEERGYEKFPLVVDLDGTLVKTDCLVECLMNNLKRNFFEIFLMPFWLLRGKAFFKFEVMRRTHLDMTHLPFNEPLVEYIKAEKAKGRTLALATASHRKIAAQVAGHLGIFDEIFASDRDINLSGSRKAKALVERYGDKGFVYAGNAAVDFKVWRHAAAAIVVYATGFVKRGVPSGVPVERVFDRPFNFWYLLMKAMRLHQWSKNVLIFLPLILANKLLYPWLLLEAVKAFFAFSITSSSVYLLNDLMDLDADRLHPENKKRPFASGELPAVVGALLSPVLLILGLFSAYLISPDFLWALAGYFILTCAYSFYLKRLVIADILVLAALYAWRLFAGSVATNVDLSNWFIIFAGFLFLSLALVKRCSELILMEKNQKKKNLRRGYTTADLNQLTIFGTASGYLSVLVLAFYFKSPEMELFYRHPKVLWLICPFLLYWVSRMWLEAQRGNMHTDPLVFAIKDRVSYVLIAIIASIWGIAVGVL